MKIIVNCSANKFTLCPYGRMKCFVLYLLKNRFFCQLNKQIMMPSKEFCSENCSGQSIIFVDRKEDCYKFNHMANNQSGWYLSGYYKVYFFDIIWKCYL